MTPSRIEPSTFRLVAPFLNKVRHRVLPQPMQFPQCERPSFAPIWNNEENYICVYFELYIFGQQAGKQCSGPIKSRLFLNKLRDW